MGSGDAAHDAGTKQARQPDGQALPELDKGLIPGIFRAQVGDTAAAHIILPFGRKSFCAPLLLEAIGAAALCRTAKIKALLVPFDGALEQLTLKRLFWPLRTWLRTLADRASHISPSVPGKARRMCTLSVRLWAKPACGNGCSCRSSR